jgi:menaquinol-cytochrome c reductase iron-sulfur subunit
MSQNTTGCRPEIVKNGTINKDRRDFLKTAALVGGSAVVTGVPLVSYFTAPALSKGTGKWVDFGPLEDLEPGSVSMLSYEFLIKDGWLVLPQRGIVWAKTGKDDKLTVFSSVCTHLSCNVIWQEETRVFECPCHAGKFDVNGRPISGPPKKPLTVLEHKIEDDNLLTFLTL